MGEQWAPESRNQQGGANPMGFDPKAALAGFSDPRAAPQAGLRSRLEPCDGYSTLRLLHQIRISSPIRSGRAHLSQDTSARRLTSLVHPCRKLLVRVAYGS